ncbi:MAG TPA: sulfatase [Candidatus Binatia bacterium]|nr:sulfatase [Candidatus Binatia bacterium]
MLDTLRADRVGPYGGSDDFMPSLSGWARQASVFKEATSVAPFTMPSVAALLTGTYPDRAGIFIHASGVGLEDHRGSTLAELARKAGRKTGAVVSNPWLARRRGGFQRGFDAFSVRKEGPVPLNDRDAEGVTDAAIAHLERFGPSPFFLWVHYFDPHMPYKPPRKHGAASGAADDKGRVMRDFAADDRDLTRIYSGADYDEADLRQASRLYDGEVRFVDEQLARLFAHLEQSGRAADTVTIVVSDHGEALGEHGLFFAHDFTLYDELMSVVLMMRGPGIAPGHRNDVVSPIDVMPTVCAMLELECEDEMDGVDLFDEDADFSSRTVFGAATPFRKRAAAFPRLKVPGVEGRWTMARRGDLKLIKIPQRRNRAEYELFDLARDAGETQNRYASAKDERLQRALEDWEEAMAEARPVKKRGRRERPDPEDEETLRSLGYLQ